MMIGDILYVNDINSESFTSRELKPFNCVQVQDHLWFIDFTSERDAYGTFSVRTLILFAYAYSRNLGWFLCNILWMRSQGSIKVWSCLWKWIMSRTKEITEELGKRVDVAHQARKVYKPSLKCLDSTNPQSDRLCTNGGNSRPLLPSWEVVDQQRSLRSRTCKTSARLQKFTE